MSENAGNLSLGLQRQTVKIKHHDPIPNIEWWDLPLFTGKRKNYLFEEI